MATKIRGNTTPIYTHITSTGTHTLIAKSSTPLVYGGIKKITIANFSDDAGGATVNVWLNNGTDAIDRYFIKNAVIPKGVTLVLEDNISFDVSLYNLKLLNAGASPALTVIIT